MAAAIQGIMGTALVRPGPRGDARIATHATATTWSHMADRAQSWYGNRSDGMDLPNS